MDVPVADAFEHYFDAVPLPLLVVSAAGVILQANPHVTEFFGYTVGELLGSEVQRLIPERYGPDAWRYLTYAGLLRAKSSEVEHDVSVVRKDGTEFPVHINCSPIPGPRGLQYLLSFVDISARKAIEARMADMAADLDRRTRELDRSREDFRYLFQRAPLPMWLYSPTTLSFVEVNDAAVDRYGYTRAEFLAMTVRDLHFPDQLSRMDAAVESARGKEFQTLRNWTQRTKSGRTVEVDTYSRAFGTGPNSVRLVAVVDVTERNAAESQLRQAQKMEAIGQLTGGIAHDFNNLLTIILGNLEMIAEECGNRPPIRDMVADALASVNRGASLTQRLLAYARQQPLEPKLVNIEDLVTDMAGLFRRSLGEQILIQHYLAPDVWRTCVDPSQLESALLNLAVNARDAMPQGGKLTIEAQNSVLDREYATANAEVAPGEYVQIAVSDTGTGMPKEVLEHILEPFYTTKPVGKGTGLGLSMVYGFVKQSGGHLKIYSEVGVGTTVKLYLPRASGANDAQEGLRISAPALLRAEHGEVILLVEDDPTIRKLVEKLLGLLGYRVLLAEDAPSALDAMSQAEELHLLFTDVVLPNGMSGVALAEEAQLRHPNLKVLYMSGYTRNALVNHHGHDENASLLSKPFRKEELARAVHKALHG